MHKLHSIAVSVVMTTALLFGTACASAAGRQPAPAAYQSDLLTWTELAAETHQDAYSALARLHPFFLTPRPSSADAHGERRTIRVFIDGDFAGDEEILRTIPVREIESIRRVQPAMAYATLGTQHLGDEVIMVRLRCRGLLC